MMIKVNYREITGRADLKVGSYIRVYSRMTAARGRIVKLNRTTADIDSTYFGRTLRYRITIAEMIGGHTWEVEPC